MHLMCKWEAQVDICSNEIQEFHRNVEASRGSYLLWFIVLAPVLLSMVQTSVAVACTQSITQSLPTSGCASYTLAIGALSLLVAVLAAWKAHSLLQQPLNQVTLALKQMSQRKFSHSNIESLVQADPASEALRLIAAVQKMWDEHLQELQARGLSIAQLTRQLATRQDDLADSIEAQANTLQSAARSIDSVVNTSINSGSVANLADAAAQFL